MGVEMLWWHYMIIIPVILLAVACANSWVDWSLGNHGTHQYEVQIDGVWWYLTVEGTREFADAFAQTAFCKLRAGRPIDDKG